MQIYAVDDHPCKAARMLCDRHLDKQIRQVVMMLNTVSLKRTGKCFGKTTTKKSAALRWVGETYKNWMWALHFACALTSEYEYRFGEKHPESDRTVHDLDSHRYKVWPGTGSFSLHWLDEHTPFVQVMPEIYKSLNPVQSYREYYRTDKASVARWDRKRKPPEWFSPPSSEPAQIAPDTQ